MSKKKHIIISDPSLRDGNHAARHQLSLRQIKEYCQHADEAGIDIVEVGHGNGVGAYSILVGKCRETDYGMLKTARENLKKFKPVAEFNKALHEAMRHKPVETRNRFAAIEETEIPAADIKTQIKSATSAG